MIRLSILTVLFAIFISACQKEFDPFSGTATRTDSTQKNDTMKAIVFEGRFDPSIPGDYYDSIVYKVKNLSATISHYLKDGTLDFQELIYYDAQQRVTQYRYEWSGAFIYRHFGYSGNSKIPTSLIDSADDGNLSIIKFTTVSTTPLANGGVQQNMRYDAQTQLTFSGEDTVWFNKNNLLLKERSHFGGGYYESNIYYNSQFLIDSAILQEVFPSASGSNGSTMVFFNVDNPLHNLSKLLYKNLYLYTAADIGWGSFGGRLTINFLPVGLFEPQVPKEVLCFFSRRNQVTEKTTYTIDQSNGVITGLTLHSHGLNGNQGTTGKVRFYR